MTLSGPWGERRADVSKCEIGQLLLQRDRLCYYNHTASVTAMMLLCEKGTRTNCDAQSGHGTHGFESANPFRTSIMASLDTMIQPSPGRSKSTISTMTNEKTMATPAITGLRFVPATPQW